VLHSDLNLAALTKAVRATFVAAGVPEPLFELETDGKSTYFEHCTAQGDDALNS
jgi:hypothetical protein